MHKTAILIIALAAIASIKARTLDRCGIVRELRNHGFPEDLLSVWVCVVENESSGKTHVIGKPNKNGSRDYGLFQINDKYWCSNTSVPGKDCNVTCDELITDDITKAAQCAKFIYKRHKFSTWYGHDRCQGALPDISNC